MDGEPDTDATVGYASNDKSGLLGQDEDQELREGDGVVGKEENNDSGIDQDPENHTESGKGKLGKFSDKASFREKSNSFLKVLEDATKYRRLPEPRGKRPGRLEEIDSPRTVPSAGSMDDELLSPRRTQAGRPLVRGKMDASNKPGAAAGETVDGAQQHKSRYSRYEDVPVTPRARGTASQPQSSLVSLPPVAGARAGMLGAGANDRTTAAMAYSRQGSDVLAKIKISSNSPTTLRAAGGKDASRISLDTHGLLSPRGNTGK